MADADDIAAAVNTSAATGVSSHANDGTQTTAHSLKDQRETADWAAERVAKNKTKLPIRYGRFRPIGGGE